jgi:membrane-associated protein
MPSLIDIFLHLDKYLSTVISHYGAWTYGMLFFIIFMETGFVVTPFLPGDSLIFAAGTIARLPDSGLKIWLVFILLACAAILGDTANYWIGHFLGDRAYHVKWIKREYLDRTHAFFEKHGGKTIFLARFVPIVRTFAPFVAGMGKMSYSYFFSYNVVGGIVWVALFSFGGYALASFPWIQEHFSIVTIFIILISLVPMLIEVWNAWREGAQAKPQPE